MPGFTKDEAFRTLRTATIESSWLPTQLCNSTVNRGREVVWVQLIQKGKSRYEGYVAPLRGMAGH